MLENMKRMKFYVYEVEGRIVGVAALQPKPDGNVGIIRWSMCIQSISIRA